MISKKKLNYKDCSVGSATRRLGSVGLDALFIVIVSIAIFFAYYGIANTNENYRLATEETKATRIECFKIQEEAKLYVFEGNDDSKYNHPITLDQQFNTYCMRQILLSEEKNAAEFEDFDVEIKNPNNLEPANFKTDELAYFYTEYVRQYNNYNGNNNDIVDISSATSLEVYFKTQYKKVATSNLDMYENFVVENQEYPYLKAKVALDLYKYLTSDDQPEAPSVYTSLKNNYYNLWTLEVNQLHNSSRFSNCYELYKSNYSLSSGVLIGGILCSYVIAFLVAILLPQILYGHGKTFGKKITALSVLSDDGNELKVGKYIGRNLCIFFLYFSFIIISCVFIGNVTTSFLYPLFFIGAFGVSLFHIILLMLIISVISFIVVIFSNDKKAIHDLLFRTLVINDKLAYEEDEEVLNPGGELYEDITKTS